MRLGPKATDDAPYPVIRERFDFDHVALADPSRGHVGLVHEDHHAAAKYAAVAVVEGIDRRVVLVVTPQRRESKHAGIGDGFVLLDPWKRQKICPTRLRVPHTHARRICQMKSAWAANPLVEVRKQLGEHCLDLVANAVVVTDERIPIDATVWQRGFRHAADDRNFGPLMLAPRLEKACGRMNHRHAVLDGDRLPFASLHVDVAARQAWEDQCLLAMNQVAAVQLGAAGNGKLQATHRRLRDVPVRHGSDKVSAEPDEYLGASVDHRFYSVHDIVPMSARRLEAEDFLELLKEGRLRLFIDAHGAVTLHIRMTAHRADTRSGLAEIAVVPQEARAHAGRYQQIVVGDLADA